MPFAAGTKLGPCEIQSPLGAGGMDEVYKAHDTRLQRDVAIKVLPGVSATDPERLARFEREAQAIAALSHPISTVDDARAYAYTYWKRVSTLIVVKGAR
jgi:serine/threonine protein kinase